jgi:hypothetical protein
VHHQGGIDQEGLNGDMKSRHRDPLNTKRFFLLKNCNVCLLSGTEFASTLASFAASAPKRSIRPDPLSQLIGGRLKRPVANISVLHGCKVTAECGIDKVNALIS